MNITATPERKAALKEVLAERDRQDEEWGGPEHDDIHTPEEWALILSCQQGKLSDALLQNPQDPEDVHRLLVEVTAVGLAALEAKHRADAYWAKRGGR